MITIYTLCYNEELVLPYFIRFYRNRFPDCRIVVYDNYSTDNSCDIALKNNCEIIKYDSKNQISDALYLEIKNNCWKDAKTDWVIVCDTDEFADVSQKDLERESFVKTNIFKFIGWSMINMKHDAKNLDDMNYGTRGPKYDKCVLFNKKFIKEINYKAGCHICKPDAKELIYNTMNYNLYHMSYINESITIDKFKRNKNRLCKENILKNWGGHYLLGEEKIRKTFKIIREKAEKKNLII